MKITFNGVVLEMVTRINRAFTDGNGLDTVVIVEGTVNNRPVTMEFDGQRFHTMEEAKKHFRKNAWLMVL